MADCGEALVESGVVLRANGDERAKKPLKPRQCHKYLQETLAGKFQDIVAGFLQEAEKGGCAHMKLAVELLESSKPAPREKKGTAQRWLEELGE